jgi:bifunctional ADP-heptose synthase (sugar kinase/adenylyltransferase)
MDSLLQTQFKVLLIGDSCIDVYHYGNVNRISPEAPVPILDMHHSCELGGMASNVMLNLSNLGCNVDIISAVIERKTRYVDIKRNAQLLRVDERIGNYQINLNDLPDDIYDCVVVSDYNKGFLSYDDIAMIGSRYTCPKFIDTKKTDLNRFFNFYVKVNHIEWEARTSDHHNAIVTYGGEKVVYGADVYYPRKVEVHDVCGAGDTFLAALSYMFCLTYDMSRAIEFGMRASEVTVRHVGVYAPKLEEVGL